MNAKNIISIVVFILLIGGIVPFMFGGLSGISGDYEGAVYGEELGTRNEGIKELEHENVDEDTFKLKYIYEGTTYETTITYDEWELYNGLNEGNVLYYDFSENSGDTVYDKSGNGNDGALINFSDTTAGAGDTGDSGWLADGGLKFDGVDDYVIVPNHDSINFISEMGIFIRAKILSSSAEIRQLAGKYNYNYYSARINNDIFQFTTKHTNGTTDSYSDTLSGYTLDVNKLYDLYCDYSQSRGDKRLYVDGNLKTIDNTANNGGDLSEYYLNPNTAPLYIGMNPYYTYSDIVIEKIIIYDRALSADEVTALNNNIIIDKFSLIPENAQIYANYKYGGHSDIINNELIVMGVPLIMMVIFVSIIITKMR